MIKKDLRFGAGLDEFGTEGRSRTGTPEGIGF